jgi:hypothetical protein
MNNLAMTSGDTRELALTVTRVGEAVDLTGAELWFLAKGPTTTISKGTTAGGIAVTDAEGGLATITISPSDTEAMTEAEILQVEVQLKTAAGAIETIVSGVQLRVRLGLITAS